MSSHDFTNVSQLLQKGLSFESKKDSRDFSRSNDRSSRPNINVVDYDTESSHDENADVCVAEWNWASTSKPFVCSSLKPASKSRQDDMCFTFDVAKCDRIFDYLLQEKQIKLPSNHVIPSLEQLRKHASCKWHHSFSHVTNDCNVFRCQVQSAINEG